MSHDDTVTSSNPLSRRDRSLLVFTAALAVAIAGGELWSIAGGSTSWIDIIMEVVLPLFLAGGAIYVLVWNRR